MGPHGQSPPDFSVHGILQATVLEWVAIPFSKISSHSGVEPKSPPFQEDSLPSEPLEKSIVIVDNMNYPMECTLLRISKSNWRVKFCQCTIFSFFFFFFFFLPFGNFCVFLFLFLFLNTGTQNISSDYKILSSFRVMIQVHDC